MTSKPESSMTWTVEVTDEPVQTSLMYEVYPIPGEVTLVTIHICLQHIYVQKWTMFTGGF